MTIACAIGMRREEVDVLITRLKKVWADVKKKVAKVRFILATAFDIANNTLHGLSFITS